MTKDNSRWRRFLRWISFLKKTKSTRQKYQSSQIKLQILWSTLQVWGRELEYFHKINRSALKPLTLSSTAWYLKGSGWHRLISVHSFARMKLSFLVRNTLSQIWRECPSQQKLRKNVRKRRHPSRPKETRHRTISIWPRTRLDTCKSTLSSQKCRCKSSSPHWPSKETSQTSARMTGLSFLSTFLVNSILLARNLTKLRLIGTFLCRNWEFLRRKTKTTPTNNRRSFAWTSSLRKTMLSSSKNFQTM